MLIKSIKCSGRDIRTSVSRRPISIKIEFTIKNLPTKSDLSADSLTMSAMQCLRFEEQKKKWTLLTCFRKPAWPQWQMITKQTKIQADVLHYEIAKIWASQAIVTEKCLPRNLVSYHEESAITVQHVNHEESNHTTISIRTENSIWQNSKSINNFLNF